MILVRSGSVALVLAASLVAIGCGSSSTSPDTAAALTPGAAALEVSKIDGAATLDVGSDGGECTSIKTLIEGKKTELQALCADKQIPVPVAHEDEGCEAGSAKKITFECVAVNLPPMPTSGCRDIEVKDEGGAIEEQGELPGALVCPRLGGAPPTDEQSGGEANDDASRPKPPMPTGDRPLPPLPPRDGENAGPQKPGAPPAPPAGFDGGKLPPPPKGIKCCAPPPGGKAPAAK